MAADAARRQATYEDVLRAPEHVVAEVLNGDLHTSPRPAGPHAEAASVLGMDLGGAFHRRRGGPGGWIILDEPELHLGRHILVPDLAGWLRSRLPAVPPTPFLEVAPDWACEVVSPGSERIDRERKLPIYARERVSHVGVVNPLERMVEVYRLDGNGYHYAAPGSCVVHEEGLADGDDAAGGDVVTLRPSECTQGPKGLCGARGGT
jgi:Uma2 family endonuclease